MSGIQGVRIPDERVIDAIESHDGVIARAAHALGVVPRGLYFRMQKDPDFKKIVMNARDRKRIEGEDRDQILVEKARVALEALLDKHDPTATIFTLKVKGGFLQVEQVNNQQTFILVDATSKNRPNIVLNRD